MRKMFGKLSGDLKIESKVDDCFYEGFVDGLFIKFRPEKIIKISKFSIKKYDRKNVLKMAIKLEEIDTNKKQYLKKNNGLKSKY